MKFIMNLLLWSYYARRYDRQYWLECWLSGDRNHRPFGHHKLKPPWPRIDSVRSFFNALIGRHSGWLLLMRDLGRSDQHGGRKCNNDLSIDLRLFVLSWLTQHWFVCVQHLLSSYQWTRWIRLLPIISRVAFFDRAVMYSCGCGVRARSLILPSSRCLRHLLGSVVNAILRIDLAFFPFAERSNERLLSSQKQPINVTELMFTDTAAGQ